MTLCPLSTCGRPLDPRKALRTVQTCRSGRAAPLPKPWGQNEALSVPGSPPSLRADAPSPSRQGWSWGFFSTPLYYPPSPSFTKFPYVLNESRLLSCG